MHLLLDVYIYIYNFVYLLRHIKYSLYMSTRYHQLKGILLNANMHVLKLNGLCDAVQHNGSYLLHATLL